MRFTSTSVFNICDYNAPTRPSSSLQSWEVQSLFRAESGQVSEAKPLAALAVYGTGFYIIGGLFRILAQLPINPSTAVVGPGRVRI